MNVQFEIHGSTANLYQFLSANIAERRHLLSGLPPVYTGFVEQGKFHAKPSVSDSMIPPRIRGEIISAGQQHTVKIRLAHMLKYHLMLLLLFLVPVSGFAAFIAITIDDLQNGFPFSFWGLLVTIVLSVVVSLPFIWMYISTVVMAKSEFRKFCEDVIRASRP